MLIATKEKIKKNDCNVSELLNIIKRANIPTTF